MTKDEALELCDYLECNDASLEAQCKAAAFIREALAQPEQKPSITKTGCGILTLHLGFDDLPDGTKFYTTPPKRPWVGLTDREWVNIVNKDQAWFGHRPDEVAHEVAKLVEAKLRELNT